MVDIFSEKKRSEIMARVKSRGNLATEVVLAKALRKNGVVGWRRHSRLFGKPDFIFRKERVALFVDGCFWHQCPIHGTMPQTNRSFWLNKLTKNWERDRLVDRTLKNLGWTSLRIWQHDLRDPDAVAQRVRKRLGKFE